MLRKSLAAMFVSLFIAGITGAAFAGRPTSGQPTPLKSQPS